MNILRSTRRTIRKQAEDTTGDVSDAAASGNTANPNEPWTRKAENVDDARLVSWLVADGWDRATAEMEVGNYRKYGLQELTETPRKAITQALRELRGVASKTSRPATTKAAVIDPKIAVVGTAFDARARIINKTNGRLLKSREFKGRFAKASARAWAEAEVKKLL